jgi:hypothetical protein
MDFFIVALSVLLKPIVSDSIVSTDDQSHIEYALLEEDYLALWEQFPFFDAVHYLFVESKHKQTSSFNQWETTFLAMETILFKLEQSLHTFNMPSQRMFARQIGQTIVRYVQISTTILKQQQLLDVQGTFHDRIFQFYNALFIKVYFCLFYSKS